MEYQETLSRLDGSGEKFRNDKFGQHNAVHTSQFDLYWDEKTHIGTLSTGTIFKLFERARTNALGGADLLLELCSGNAHVYVARVSDYEIVRDIDVDSTHVVVKSMYEPLGSLEGGVSMINFHQYVCDVSDMTILSRAIVTCSCVDTLTRRATTFPNQIAKIFFQLEKVQG